MRLFPGKSHAPLENAHWLRPLLIVLPILLGAAVATVASGRQLVLVAIAVVSLGALVVFLRYPPLAIIAATIAGLFIPFYGPSGSNITMLLVAATFGLWFADMALRQQNIRLVSSRATWPILAFIALSFLSFGFGLLPWFTFVSNTPLQAQLGGLSVTVLSAVAFLLAANLIKDLTWLKWLVWTFLVAAVLSFAGRTFLPLFGLPTRDLFQSVGSLFYVWMVALAFSQAIFNQELPTGWRVALASISLTVVFLMFYFKFGDKSGWLPTLVSFCVLIAFRSKYTLVGVIAVGFLLAYVMLPEAIAVDEYSISTRLEAWTIMAQIIQLSPIWGLGFANYYSFTTLFPIRGYAVSFNSHNNYVDIVAQMGLVGLACLLWFFLEIFSLGWRLRREAPDGFARAYVYGALAGLVGTLVAGMLGDWMVPFVYNIGLFGFRTSVLAWIFLGGLVTIEQVAARTYIAE